MFGAATGGSSFRSGQYGINLKTTTVASYAEARQLQKFVDAIKEEDIKTMRKIIKKGIDANIDLRFETGMEKMTALHFAACKGLVLASREILQAKCDLNKETPFDLSTALHFACLLDDSEASAAIVKDLLSYGANPNLLDHTGRTPLYLAVQKGEVNVIKLLLRYGGDAGIVCSHEEFPDAIRHMSKHLDLMESELEEMYDPYQGNSPLIQASREHFADVVKELLKSDCDINYCNAAGNTALHVAAKSESRNTYTEQRVKRTRFPLSGSSEIVELLINAGCDMDFKNLQQDTPLKRAIDGLREIFSWSFPTEDKIEQAKAFCDVASCLVLSGCDVATTYADKTILSVLLRASPQVQQADSRALTQKYVLCMLHLLAAGVLVSADEFTHMQCIKTEDPMLTSALIESSQRPWPLKQLCKLTLRKYLRLPLRKNIKALALPKALKEYVSLETNV